MEEITKKAIRFTDLKISPHKKREELINDLVDAHVYFKGAEIFYEVVFCNKPSAFVSKEDFNWCLKYLEGKGKRNDK